MLTVKEIYLTLLEKYEVYSTVYGEILMEAIENTLQDIGKTSDIEKIHKHIMENYI